MHVYRCLIVAKENAVQYFLELNQALALKLAIKT
jgi:hypothetical protein